MFFFFFSAGGIARSYQLRRFVEDVQQLPKVESLWSTKQSCTEPGKCSGSSFCNLSLLILKTASDFSDVFEMIFLRLKWLKFYSTVHAKCFFGDDVAL